MLTALKRPADALARQRQALAAFEALAAADPANVAARNDMAISLSKIAEMLDAAGGSADAVREFQRALDIHLALAAKDPASDSLKLELASDYNRLATGAGEDRAREASLVNHTRAVTMSRELQREESIQRRAAGRVRPGAGGPGGRLRSASPAAARRGRPGPLTSNRPSVTTPSRSRSSPGLQKAGSIQGTDLETLENNRRELERVRTERSR